MCAPAVQLPEIRRVLTLLPGSTAMPHLTQIKGACPHNCPDTCGWVVTLDEAGTPVKIQGDPDHPYTRGWLCTKVNRYLEWVLHPDRLRHPMRRVGAKGEGRFERISWDEA